MRHIQITAFIVRLIGLALIVHLLREHFDVGLYADAPVSDSLATEPSFRFAGIYLLHATHGFWVVAISIELLGSLLLFAAPHPFARLLWSGICINGVNQPKA